MSFNYKITKNSSLPEVLEIIPDHFDDHRGSLWTSFSPEIYENELLDKKIKFHHDKFSTLRNMPCAVFTEIRSHGSLYVALLEKFFRWL